MKTHHGRGSGTFDIAYREDVTCAERSDRRARGCGTFVHDAVASRTRSRTKPGPGSGTRSRRARRPSRSTTPWDDAVAHTATGTMASPTRAFRCANVTSSDENPSARRLRRGAASRPKRPRSALCDLACWACSPSWCTPSVVRGCGHGHRSTFHSDADAVGDQGDARAGSRRRRRPAEFFVNYAIAHVRMAQPRVRSVRADGDRRASGPVRGGGGGGTHAQPLARLGGVVPGAKGSGDGAASTQRRAEPKAFARDVLVVSRIRGRTRVRRDRRGRAPTMWVHRIETNRVKVNSWRRARAIPPGTSPPRAHPALGVIQRRRRRRRHRAPVRVHRREGSEMAATSASSAVSRTSMPTMTEGSSGQGPFPPFSLPARARQRSERAEHRPRRRARPRAPPAPSRRAGRRRTTR